ncbi:MAG: hypothetical protein WC712_11030 [Candidatus Brocadiia bacterium]
MGEFLTSPYMIAFGYLIGVLGVILTIVFYRKGRRIKRLTYASRAFNLISSTASGLPGFEAKYKGVALENLTALKILIWNSGTEIISEADIAESDPIRIQLPEDVSALDARVTAMATPTNLASAGVSLQQMSTVDLTFDYFGAGEGCLVSILHTGRQYIAVSLTGTIKGHGQPRVHAASAFTESAAVGVSVGMITTGIAVIVASLVADTFRWELLWSLGVLVLSSIGIVLLAHFLSRKAGGDLDSRFGGAFTPSEFSKNAPGRESK